jgi:hypothetical protein
MRKTETFFGYHASKILLIVSLIIGFFGAGELMGARGTSRTAKRFICTA